jgi:hypothetical protein
MSVRTGLTNLVRRLRGMTQAGTADWSIIQGDGSTVFWWSDDQLYEVMDLHATDYFMANLRGQFEQDSGGTVRTFTYYAPAGNLEEATSGTVYWSVRDTTGSVVGTASYSVEYSGGIVHFNADTKGTVYQLRARSYNLNRAAADLWREKSANAAKYFDFKSDNQSFSKSQFMDHCLKMATYYDNQAGLTVSRMVRTDLLPRGGGYR